MSKDKLKSTYSYDEYQKTIMYKYGTRSFVFLIILLFISGMVNVIYQNISQTYWGTPSVESFLPIFISLLYFVHNVTLKGAYIPFNNSKIFALSSIGLIVGGSVQLTFFIIIITKVDQVAFLKNGVLQDISLLLFSGIFLVYNGCIILYKYYNDILDTGGDSTSTSSKST